MLVVEDETNLAEAIAYNLRREGYDASTAVDGYSGLDAALVQRPEVLVLDLDAAGFGWSRALSTPAAPQRGADHHA